MVHTVDRWAEKPSYTLWRRHMQRWPYTDEDWSEIQYSIAGDGIYSLLTHYWEWYKAHGERYVK